MKENSRLLFDKLQLLANGEGYFIMSIGDHYVQFTKERAAADIHFEAVSHHFLKTVPEYVRHDFERMHFQIDDANYYKAVNIYDIDSIIRDAEIIFKDIYRLDYGTPCEIADEIES